MSKRTTRGLAEVQQQHNYNNKNNNNKYYISPFVSYRYSNKRERIKSGIGAGYVEYPWG